MTNPLEEAKRHLLDAGRDLEQNRGDPDLARVNAHLALAAKWIDIARTEKGVPYIHVTTGQT